MKIKYKRILFRCLIMIGIIITFQSCDFFSPLRDSKRKQKALESKIDSLKNEHSKINKDLETMEHVLDMIEYTDSVFAPDDSLKNANSNL